MHPRAKFYAQPLFSLCVEKNITKEMLSAVQSLASIDDQEIIKVLSYPIISKQDKKEIIDELRDTDIPQELLNLLKLLIDFDEVKMLGDILENYVLLYQHEYGVEIVKATFAKEPTSEKIKKLKEMLANKLGSDKEIIIQSDVDTSLIGGIVIEYNDKVIDNSVKTHLNQLINNL